MNVIRPLSQALSDWEVAEAYESHRRGDTLKRLGDRYGVSHKTLQRAFKRLEERQMKDMFNVLNHVHVDEEPKEDTSAEWCWANCKNQGVCERLHTLHCHGEPWEWCECGDCAEFIERGV